MTAAGPPSGHPPPGDGTGPIYHVTLSAGDWTLRPPMAADAADSLHLLTDPETALWNPVPQVVDLESARAWCARGADWSSGNHATWSVVGVAGRLVGNVSLWEIDREDQRRASVGYRTASWARGQGVASAAVAAASSWAFGALGIERIELVHCIANAASGAVARNAGFVPEGTLRQEYRDQSGRRWDSHLHSRLATDPEPAARKLER